MIHIQFDWYVYINGVSSNPVEGRTAAVKTLVQECCQKSVLFFFLLISFICTSIRISYIYRATAHKERISRFPSVSFIYRFDYLIQELLKPTKFFHDEINIFFFTKKEMSAPKQINDLTEIL